jgi:hypothetical protein
MRQLYVRFACRASVTFLYAGDKKRPTSLARGMLGVLGRTDYYAVADMPALPAEKKPTAINLNDKRRPAHGL